MTNFYYSNALLKKESSLIPFGGVIPKIKSDLQPKLYEFEFRPRLIWTSFFSKWYSSRTHNRTNQKISFWAFNWQATILKYCLSQTNIKFTTLFKKAGESKRDSCIIKYFGEFSKVDHNLMWNKKFMGNNLVLYNN